MPTLCGLRRRGYTPASILDFLERVGVSKADSVVDTAMLEHCLREELNLSADRMMAVLDPIKLVVENWPEGEYMDVSLENLPDGSTGSRTVRFGRELLIEREDFCCMPPKKYFRLKPECEVRLKGAYIVKCARWESDADGKTTTVYCTYDPYTRSGECERKVKGTIHWLNAEDAVPAEFRLYEPLLLPEEENDERDFVDRLDPDSLVTLHGFVEPALAAKDAGYRCQFMRTGYFCADLDHTAEKPVYNRIVGLKDSFKE